MGHLIARCGLALLPVAAAALLAAATDLVAEPGPHLACRILPNGMVPVLAGRSAGCTLEPYDHVIPEFAPGAASPGFSSELRARAAAAAGDASIALAVIRRGEARRVGVPLIRDTRAQAVGRFAAAVLVAAVVMAVSLMILWGSSEPAAAPFAAFYSCVSVALFSVLCGRYSDVLVVPGVVASGTIPATLAHLALTFPRERELLRRAPSAIRVVYGFGALLTLIAVVNMNRSPTVWALADRVILLLSLGAWGLLVMGCAAALRESQSVLDRARAKVVLAGTAVVPAVPLVLGVAFGPSLPGGPLALLTIAVAVLPLPIGYAISHYRLFDLGVDLRRAISHVLYLAASAAVAAGAIVGSCLALGARPPLGDPVVLFSVAFVGFLVGDPLRARLRGAIDSWMSADVLRMARAADAHAQGVGELLEADDCARLLAGAVAEGVAPVGASVFLIEEGDWRLAHAWGRDAPVWVAAATTASKAAGGARLCCLADQEPLQEPVHAALRDMGVEVVAPLRSGDQGVGLLLLTRSRRGSPYTTPQLRFVERLARQSAVAIHKANLARSLLLSERLATQGRLGAGLIHDLGKPLGVIEQLARRIPRRGGDAGRVARDVRTIADLSAQMRATLREFLETSRRAVAEGPGACVEVVAVIDRAVGIVERSHGRERVSVRLAPDLPRLGEGGSKLVRALSNLLDNALLASAPGDVVEVAAGTGDGWLEIAVIDRGCGMDREVRSRAFEPFFTTRPRGRGNGLGLSVCLDLVGGLGGRIDLDSAPGAGTRVRLRLPLSPPEGRDA